MQADGRMNTTQIRESLKRCQQNGITYKQIETETGVSRTAISQLANHGVAMHTAKLAKVEGWLASNGWAITEAAPEQPDQVPAAPHQMRMATGKPQLGIYPTQDMQKLVGWLNAVYQHRAIGALVGPAGSGKTTALREYCKVNPEARYVKCWALMHMGDLLDMIAEAFNVAVSGSQFRRQQQLIRALVGSNAMLLLDEAEFLKSWNIKKLEVLREIWDAIGIPIVLCGTEGLEAVLTRGTGRDNCAQLYRRCWQGVTSGIGADEMSAILGEYQMTQDAAQVLVRMATDHKHGGMGNAFEVLRICLELAEGGLITGAIIKEASQYKVLFK